MTLQFTTRGLATQLKVRDVPLKTFFINFITHKLQPRVLNGDLHKIV